jgi:hypothetical protein
MANKRPAQKLTACDDAMLVYARRTGWLETPAAPPAAGQNVWRAVSSTESQKKPANYPEKANLGGVACRLRGGIRHR